MAALSIPKPAFIAYPACWLVGVLLATTVANDRIVGLGLGLQWPGGGLLLYRHWIEFALVQVLVLVSCVQARRTGHWWGLLAVWVVVPLFLLTHSPGHHGAWMPAVVVVASVGAIGAAAVLAAFVFRTKELS